MAPKLYITLCYTKHKQDLPGLNVNNFWEQFAIKNYNNKNLTILQSLTANSDALIRVTNHE
jgi:hypothetical protein